MYENIQISNKSKQGLIYKEKYISTGCDISIPKYVNMGKSLYTINKLQYIYCR